VSYQARQRLADIQAAIDDNPGGRPVRPAPPSRGDPG
jgi:hypothetical protein